MTKAERTRMYKLVTTLKGMNIYFSAMCNNASDAGDKYRAARAHERAYAAAQVLELLSRDDYLDHLLDLYGEFAVHYDAEHSED